MINLFKIKGQKKEEAANSNGGPPVKKQSLGICLCLTSRFSSYCPAHAPVWLGVLDEMVGLIKGFLVSTPFKFS